MPKLKQPALNRFATELSRLINKYGESPMSIACNRLYRKVRELSDKFNDENEDT